MALLYTNAYTCLGFVVDLASGLLKAPLARWEHLRMDVLYILNSKGIRVHARKLASLVGTIISMKIAWGPATQLYERNLYHILNNVCFLNCWVTVCDEALNELYFWKDLPRLRFESIIWPSAVGLSIRVSTVAGHFG